VYALHSVTGISTNEYCIAWLEHKLTNAKWGWRQLTKKTVFTVQIHQTYITQSN